MKGLSLWAKLLIATVLIYGVRLALWQFTRLDLQTFDALDLGLLLTACVLASVFQTMKTHGANPASSYNLSWVVYGGTFLLLGTPETILVIVVAHTAEWVWYRQPWYIQSFNMAAFTITASIAGMIYEMAMTDHWPSSSIAILLVFAACVVFTVVNHLFIGMFVKQVRGHSLSESGVFSRTALMTDMGMLCLGAIVALISPEYPTAVIFVAVVAYILHGVPQIPELRRQNQREPKTGLYNFVYLNTALERELAHANRHNRPLSIVMADLDKLREINNSYGHLAGDAVIKKIAQILQASARDNDTVARFGGEEFAILMPNIMPDQAVVHVEAMRRAIEAAEFSVQGRARPIKATMSFGVAGCNGRKKQALELLHNADLAVYHAKRAGRNCTHLHGGDGGCLALPAEIETIVPSGAVELLYADIQPSYDHLPADSERLKMHDTVDSHQEDVGSVLGAQKGSSFKLTRNKYLNAYIAIVAVAALILSGLVAGPFPEQDLTGIILFVLTAAVAEFMATYAYSKDTSISASVAPLLAATMVYGPIGAVAVALTITAIAQLKERMTRMHLVFNFSNHLIGALLGAGVIVLSGREFLDWPVYVQIIFTLLSAMMLYLSITPLVAGAVGLSTGQTVIEVWRERFMWLAPHYLGFGFLAYALIFGYVAMGTMGVLVLLVPLLMVHFGQRQYIVATDAIVAQLRKTNEKLHQQSKAVRKLNDELFLALAGTIDLRDPDVMEHSINVARYAVLIAQELGLSLERIELVRRAGLMHDIGKLAIPEAVLFKPARLTTEEHELVMEHTTIGADLLAEFQALRNIAKYVRYHHERYDGYGYPEGLPGMDIPLEARILALSDAVEAMASDRPYRKGMPAEEILQEINKHAGTQFDPFVVEAFKRVVKKQGDLIINNSARGLLDDELRKLLNDFVPTGAQLT